MECVEVKVTELEADGFCSSVWRCPRTFLIVIATSTVRSA